MSWQQVKIGSFLKRIKRSVDVQNNIKYKRITISSNHNGIKLRDVELGANIGTKSQFIVKDGDFVLSKIDARNGAFGIINKDVDDAIITGNFWAYIVDNTMIDSEWFFYFTHSSAFIEICSKSSTGTTHRKYLDEKIFLSYKLTLPDLDVQRNQVADFKALQIQQSKLNSDICLQKEYLAKLKQSILQDAICGKLTEDWRAVNVDVEPASELLKRIKVEKQQLIKDGKIRKEKPLDPITDTDLPFPIPPTWQWCRLGEMLNIKSGKRIHASDYVNNGVPFLRSGEIGMLGRGETLRSQLYISNNKYVYIKEKFGVPKDGDILIACIGGSIGNTWIIDDREFYYKDGNLVLIEMIEHLSNIWLNYYLKSDTFWHNTILNATDSSYNALTIEKLNDAIIPLPPQKEQKRIVEIIKNSLEKCSLIEAQITANELTAQNLLKSLLSETFNNN